MIRIKATPLILHVVAWLLFLSFPLLFMTQGKPFGQLTVDMVNAHLSFCGLYIAIFYLKAEFLLPAFFFKQRYLSYALLLLLLFSAVYYIKPFDNLVNKNHHQRAAGKSNDDQAFADLYDSL